MNRIKEHIISLYNHKTIRNGGLFSIFSFFNKGIAFLLLMILAKYIAPDQYGSLSLFNTIVTFFGFTAGFSTAGYLSVSYFKNKVNDLKNDLTSIIIITISGSIVLFIIILGLNGWLSNLLKLSEKLLIVALYVSFSSIVWGLWLDYFRLKENIIKYGLISCGFALINFLTTLYFIINKETGWIGFVYSLTICNLLFSLFSIFYFVYKKLFIYPKNWERVKRILFWGLPLIPHTASTWIKQGLDRYIIDSYYSISEVGIFSFALNLTNIIVMIGIAFNQTNSVNIYKTLSVKNTTSYTTIQILYKKEKMFMALYAAITMIVLLGVSLIIPILMPKYVDSLTLFYLLSIFGLAYCYYLVYCNYLFYFNKTIDLMYITFGLSILHLILSIILTKYSLIYTCIIYLSIQLIITLLVYVRSRKLLIDYQNEKNL